MVITDSKHGWQHVRDVLLPDGTFAVVYTKGRLHALVSREPHIERGVAVLRWHMSISRADRYPNWDEIKRARYDLVPDDVYMAQILPPTSEYVNVHPNCFHLHEIPAEVASGV